MKFTVLAGEYSVHRFKAGTMPAIDFSALAFACVTRTSEETSVVCPSGVPLPAERTEAGWRALKIEGPLDFGLIGILAEASGILAEAGISIFAISTFDTDYILVKRESLERAAEALAAKGHTVKEPAA